MLGRVEGHGRDMLRHLREHLIDAFVAVSSPQKPEAKPPEDARKNAQYAEAHQELVLALSRAIILLQMAPEGEPWSPDPFVLQLMNERITGHLRLVKGEVILNFRLRKRGHGLLKGPFARN